MDASTLIDHKALLESASAIEALPTSVARLARLVADQDSSIREVVEVVSYDQSLTASVLRRSNSAALAGMNPIRTVHEAAVRLGPSTLLSIALSSSVSRRMNRAIPAYGLKDGELWGNSVAAAFAAETIRGRATVEVPAEASTAALLHDFGKVVLAGHFGSQVLDMLALAASTEGVDVCDAEMQIFGATHADIGGIVAQQWKLPSSIVDAIVHHHATRVDLPPICATVSLAHLMSVEVAGTLDEAGLARQPDRVEAHAPLLAGLGIPVELYPDLVATTRARFAELADRYDD